MQDEHVATADYVYYEPKYFAFSETYRAWVKLFIDDCYGLTRLEGFEGTHARFYKNHPIRWIQLVAIVTGVTIRAAHAEIEIDDGSGSCIDLFIKNNTEVSQTINLDCDRNDCSVTVGHLVRVKGTLADDFKSHLQVVVEKLEVLHDPFLELLAWQERVAYKDSVLNVPWKYKDNNITSSSTLQKKAITSHKAHERAKQKETRRRLVGVDLPSLDVKDHTQRNLKIVFLQYFHAHNIREFSLQQLRACRELEDAAACVAKRALVMNQISAKALTTTTTEYEIGQSITSSQKYRTMNACLVELVRDGSIISLSAEKGNFSVVGTWNLGRVMQKVMQEMFAKDTQRTEVTVREIWQAVRQSGHGFESISKQMVQRVLLELQGRIDQPRDGISAA